MKTIERSFTPSKLWERVRLSRNFATALKQIDENLAYWNGHIRTKCKARFVRLTQVLVRMRRFAMHPDNRVLKRRNVQSERREKVRAKKAEAAAMIDHQIKKELFSRLLKGTYPTEVVDLDKGLQQLLQNPVTQEEEEQEHEYENEEEREYEMENEEEDGETYPVEYVEGDYYDDDDVENDVEGDDDVDEEDDEEDEEVKESGSGGKDIEDLVSRLEKKMNRKESADEKKKKASVAAKRKSVSKKGMPADKKRKPYVEIEYEQETDINTESINN